VTATQAQQILAVKLPSVKGLWSEFRNQQRLVIEASDLMQVLRCLKAEAHFDQLTDLTVVDHLEMEDAEHRFEVVYCLLDTESGQRLIVKTFLDEPDLTLPSATSLWFGADWLEREAYDMFGIEFAGHPNFKRLLLPQEFTSFPLRKDYPQQGRGERHNFPVITRAES
jgi:NADH-quinone oxidoreductase subunit C